MQDDNSTDFVDPDSRLLQAMEAKLDSARNLLASDPKAAEAMLADFFEDAKRLIAAAQVPGALQAYGADCAEPDALERLRSAIQTAKELSAQISENRQ